MHNNQLREYISSHDNVMCPFFFNYLIVVQIKKAEGTMIQQTLGQGACQFVEAKIEIKQFVEVAPVR